MEIKGLQVPKGKIAGLQGFSLEKNDGDVPARTKFYDPVLE